MSEDNLFGSITIQRDEALPKRLVAGRESIPNPFVEAVHDSYREATDTSPDKAVRAIFVPVDPKSTTVRTVVRKDKNGKESATQWQQHPNIVTALYLLRQAAIKNDIGVRIVVDYDQTTVPTVTHTDTVKDKDGKPVLKDGKEQTKTTTYTDVTLNKFKVQTSGANKGRVRVRFLGQKKKEQSKKDSAQSPEQQNA